MLIEWKPSLLPVTLWKQMPTPHGVTTRAAPTYGHPCNARYCAAAGAPRKDAPLFRPPALCGSSADESEGFNQGQHTTLHLSPEQLQRGSGICVEKTQGTPTDYLILPAFECMRGRGAGLIW